MTDIRTRLVDAICAAEFRPRETVEAIVDVLLSLPGIAIVDTDADLERVAERMADADDGIIYGLLTPDEAGFYLRMAGAALLTAANAAEADA